MKSEFKARPVYLSRDDRIIAHFMTCFISLIIYRILEKRLGEKYTCHEILNKLKEMDFFEIKGEGYIPTFLLLTSVKDEIIYSIFSRYTTHTHFPKAKPLGDYIP